MDYCIRKLLGLTEENFITDENWLDVKFQSNFQLSVKTRSQYETTFFGRIKYGTNDGIEL